MKPQLFIGPSIEAINIANAIQSNLEYAAGAQFGIQKQIKRIKLFQN